MNINKKGSSAAKAAADAHFSGFKSLISSKFISKVVSKIFNPTKGKIFARALDRVQEKMSPKSSKTHIEYDAIIRLLQPHSPNPPEVVTIAVETKTHLKDLLNDQKLIGYAGSTDYLFLSVPSTLVLNAYEVIVKKYSTFKQFIGICDYETGTIVIFPERQRADRDRTSKLLSKFMISPKCLPGGDYIYNDIEIIEDNDADDFVEYQGLNVNKKYLHYIKDWHAYHYDGRK